MIVQEGLLAKDVNVIFVKVFRYTLGEFDCLGYCINGGVCLLQNATSDSHLKPAGCACPEGFHGARCEIDHCTKNPDFCKNQGSLTTFL